MRHATLRQIAARGTAPATLLALCLAFTACGGSSGPSSAASTATSAVHPHPEASTPSGKSPPERPAAQQRSGAGAQRQPIPAKLRQKAGRAAPFLTSQGDNSIPTYGGEGSGSQEAEAAGALAAYLKARAAGEWGRACSLMGATVRRQLAVLSRAGGGGGGGCAKISATLSKRLRASELANPMVGGITALRVKGEKAFALFYGPHRQQFLMPMVSEGGSWKVNQSIPIAYPIGAPVRGGH